jgi:hypothetical protein
VLLAAAGCNRRQEHPESQPFVLEKTAFRIATPDGLYLLQEREAILIAPDLSVRRWGYGGRVRLGTVMGIALRGRDLALSFEGLAPVPYYGVVVLRERWHPFLIPLYGPSAPDARRTQRPLGIRWEENRLVLLTAQGRELLRTDFAFGDEYVPKSTTTPLLRPAGIEATDDIAGAVWLGDEMAVVVGELAAGRSQRARVVRLGDGSVVREGYAWSAAHLASGWIAPEGTFLSSGGRLAGMWRPEADHAVVVDTARHMSPFRASQQPKPPAQDGLLEGDEVYPLADDGWIAVRPGRCETTVFRLDREGHQLKPK